MQGKVQTYNHTCEGRVHGQALSGSVRVRVRFADIAGAPF